MKTKILLWIMFLFLLVGASEAALVGYWSMDDGTGTNLGNSINPLMNGTLVNTPAWVTGKIGSYALNFSASSSEYADLRTAHGLIPNQTINMSISFWFNAFSPGSGVFQYLIESSVGTAGEVIGINGTGGLYTARAGIATPITKDKWYFFVWTKNTTEINTYVDGVLNLTVSKPMWEFNQSIDAWCLGCSNIGSTPTNFANATLDDFALWNHTLSPSDIAFYWNSGTGRPANSTQTTVSNFTVTAQNIYDSSAITEFNATIGGVVYGTTTGTITTGILQNATQVYDINITVPNHFNATYSGYNVSSNLVAKIIQAIVRINPLDLNNDSLSLPFNLSTASYYNNSNLLYLKNTSIAITFQKYGYINKTQTYSISALQNNTLDMTEIYQSVLNVTAANKAGTAITTFSINATNSEYSTVVSTTNGSAIIPVLNENYNITVDADGYELKTVQVNLSSDYTYNFSLYGTNTLNITFKNELTGALLSGINISINLFGTVNYTNSSTETGKYFISLLYPSEYTIRYSSPGYPERFYYFTMINRTVQDLTLYLLANPSNITITVYDEISHYVQGATVKAQRYDLATNSYILVEMVETNFEGQGILHLQKFSEFYKFVIEYGGETKLTTTPTYIYTDSLTFQINLASDIGEDYYNSQNIDWELTFNNVTNNFRFFYNDPSNVVSQGCLYVYTTDLINDEVLYNSSCSSSTSATLLAGVAAVNGTTYRAKAVVTFSDGDYTLGDMFKSFAGEYVTNKMGLFAIIILTMVLLMIGYWNPAIAVILAPLPAIFGSMIHLIDIHFTYLIPIEVLAIIIAVIISRKA